MDSIFIKKSSEKDWKDLKKARLASLKDSPEAFESSYERCNSFSKAQWKERASENKLSSFFLAYEKDQVIGIVGGYLANAEYSLISMWVDPKFRSMGLGRKLVEKLLNHAKKNGHSEVLLEVLPANQKVCNFYLHCGFKFRKPYSGYQDKVMAYSF